MKRLRICLFPVILLFAASVAPGDTITLNSGEKLDGKIVDETSTAITIEVKVSAGVMDQKTVQKSEIHEMDRETPDAAAYEQIKKLAPGMTSLPSAADYDSIIETLGNFTKQYPDSPHAADVKRVVQEFSTEKSRIEAGEFKYGGQWLSKTEFQKQKTEIMAGLLYDTMKSCSAAGDLVGAMNALDQIEKKYPGASVYPDAVELGQRVLVALQQSLAHWTQKLQYDTAQWKQGIEITAEPKKSQLIAAYNTEQLRYDAAMAAAQKNGQKWKPLIPRSEKSLEGLQALASTERTRLAAINLSNIRQSVQLADKAEKSIAASEPAAAEPMLSQAKTLWPANAKVEILQAKLTASKAPTTSVAATQKTKTAEVAAAVAAAAQKAQQAAAEETPFYKTPMGALMIFAGAIVVLGIVSLVNRFAKPRTTATKSK